MLEVLKVDPGSIAEELAIETGDLLIAVNGEPLRDLVDYALFAEREELELEVRKRDGETWILEFEKDAQEDLGIHLSHPEPSQCGNNCIFCFVHQLPRGMRRTLYVKDEDYRFSYLYGSYVTLTNIGEDEIQRILKQRLSPLFVSVHTTDDRLRERMLGRGGPAILPLLRRLTEGGIQVHTQIVLCPGFNDGENLWRTVEDLHGLFPGIASLAVVPVGLTGHRENLPALRPPTPVEASRILNELHKYQERYRAEGGSRFLFAADEFYLLAGEPFPDLSCYEDLPQLENGVGMVPMFRHQGREVLSEAAPLQTAAISTVTGESFYPAMKDFLEALSQRTGVTVHLHRIRNEFFGGHVSVAGLITGRDILRQLKDKALGTALVIPDVMLREGEEVFLDDLTPDDLQRELKIPVHVIGSTPWDLLDYLELQNDQEDERHDG